ncbi:Na+/H+ antiporter NhaA [Actinocorallia longicatena]|uniref:Na(+)/H(+) antiporter NhaA n=1 Tax=Actinocorallia longicatena TaxID=111803 RepID=A0ABP6QAT5_9ACTN
MSRRRAAVFPLRPTVRHARNLAEALRTETIGGIVMLAATVVALLWANSPWKADYTAFTEWEFGPSWFHLTVAHFASDGLLAVFFFIAGLELREELAHGELKRLSDALLPVLAAVGGVIMPALIYLAVSAGVDDAGHGWAIPTATDIAFALAVLAITFSNCPPALRAFLLTLAVVDDLIAITIIALFYSTDLRFGLLAVAAALVVLYGLLQRRGVRSPWIYAPIGIAAWAFTYKSGIHATVAGVALGLLTSPAPDDSPDELRSNAEYADHVLRPFSAGICVPLFALVSAGVALSPSLLGEVFRDRIALGVILGLIVGKFMGVLAGAYVAVRLGFARLGDGLHWRDLAAVAMLAGVGFTVSLLIGDLAYEGTEHSERVTTAVLIASLVASLVATVAFRFRVRVHAQEGKESHDDL